MWHTWLSRLSWSAASIIGGPPTTPIPRRRARSGSEPQGAEAAHPATRYRSDILDRGHHPGLHMIAVMAVERPAAGVVGVEGDRDAGQRRHHDGVAAGALKALAVDR